MSVHKRVLAPLAALCLAACEPSPDAQAAPATHSTDVSAAAAPAARASRAAAPAVAAGPQPGRWAGAVTEGYDADSIHFTVSPAGVVSDVVFSGHWRCASSTSSFRTIKPMDVGHVPGTFQVAENGAFGGEQKEPYLLWTVSGQFTGASAASGNVRVEYATECDTHRLSWTAAPVAG